MKQINTLIVDDEFLALKRIETILKSDKDFIIQASCTSSKEALAILSQKEIDLLLVDIEMPELTGMEMIQHLENKKKPLVVFVTAYDDFAIQAFEYYALDYILKPFSNERFQKMLHRVKEQIGHYTQKTVSWKEMQHSIDEKKLPGRITVKTGKKYHLIDPMQIAYICAKGNHCEIKLTTGEKHIHRDSLSHLISILPEDKFIRIHHSYAVAIGCIKQARRLPFGELEVKTTDDVFLKVSRKYKEKVKQLLKV